MNLVEAVKQLETLANQPIRSYSTVDFGRGKKEGTYSVLVNSIDAYDIITSLRSKLEKGLIVFIGTTNFLANNAPEDEVVEVVLAEGESQFDILRIAETDACNYDMMTEELIKKLQEYDRAFGIDITQAETDTVRFFLKNEPEDWTWFCNDLYDFCPDIVDQGCGSLEVLEEEIKKRKAVSLWWD
ncbi:DUF4253 domain-containing protein [Aneurinibacillus aneurinilyticus]|uniref:DUF4253 domain-containing protein n=1 Tax=Aneurinibacillus aneurinilyticus ATCC 12856 TaxID=649747 RepID=U1YA02_ANEAE|nr:DUF4253 domain-containing protein [Aneurinibacillus aneurinilyticus]ERI08977.1 hypothetical protein HMPREF0083_02923 [Aneurinibacillus aneurinilyticus ATCC 12856]MED0709752.1 DUF4253 domain-containing protein [Aneurinibacillus aneurinilyticus]MED0726310.1 DUF4253 domain-containing protein [Aneurinibacillus aneurinilyticus]MED0733617.1 DUF4253 domain-containing protein [Aneurinibacillus aneurinilyticus]MED0743919.1 DUF4253 domain-containing protein [Aneurinibacillus aneurinilyticus]